MAVIKLEQEFVGSGEVSGMVFTQLLRSLKGFLYQVENEGSIHYEVFRKKKSPVCIDFEKRLYSETEFKETYPRSTAFGDWAWTIKNKDRAVEVFNELKGD